MPKADHQDENLSVIAELRAALEEATELRIQTEGRLRQSHAELQAFALSLAHDVREAIRTVNAYCELVALESHGAAEERSRAFRPHVSQAIERVQKLMTGVVEYTTAGSEGRKFIAVSMNRVFDEAARSVAEAGETKPELKRDELPVVKGEFDKLSRVLRHLLENAVKFSESARPAAHLSARLEGTEWVFSLRDNGPGIDDAYRSRIFELFKRLHGKEIPGSGLGLAYCKKIIEWHGGRIWVESQRGAGATFFFTLPAVD